MPRSRLVTLLGVVLLASFLVPTAVLAGPAPAGGRAASVAAAKPPITLGCAVVVPVPNRAHPAIACRWTALEGARVRAYRVWRSVDGGPRRLVATVTPARPLRHVDRQVRAGHVYRYLVAAIGPGGKRVGASNVVTVRVGRAPEALRFNCSFKVDATRGVLCRWAASTRPAAVRYVLYRSVDGGAREAIHRMPLDGRRAFLDRDVKAGQRIRYAVVALAADGRVVGIGGPDGVLVPRLAARVGAR